MAKNNNNSSNTRPLFKIGSTFQSSVGRIIKTINWKNVSSEPRPLQPWQIQRNNPLNILLVVPTTTKARRKAPTACQVGSPDSMLADRNNVENLYEADSGQLNDIPADHVTESDVDYVMPQQVSVCKVSDWRRNVCMYSSVDSNQWSDSGVETNSGIEDYNNAELDRLGPPVVSNLSSKGRYRREVFMAPNCESVSFDHQNHNEMNRTTNPGFSRRVDLPQYHVNYRYCPASVTDEFSVQHSTDSSDKNSHTYQDRETSLDYHNVIHSPNHASIHSDDFLYNSHLELKENELTISPVVKLDSCQGTHNLRLHDYQKEDNNHNSSISTKSLALLSRWRYEPRCRKAMQCFEQYDNHGFELDTLT